MGGIGKPGASDYGKMINSGASGSGKDVASGNGNAGVGGGMRGAASEVNSGKFTQVKNGVKNNFALPRKNNSFSRGSGPGNRGKLLPGIQSQGNKKNRKKGVAAANSGSQVAMMGGPRRIAVTAKGPTNFMLPKKAIEEEVIDSASVLRHLHKEVNDFVSKLARFMETTEGEFQKEVSVPVTGLNRTFDVVASNLVEALAVISE
ncbi:hypothetical protein LWI28_003333 [Acer negundo]|uniref:Uncharacterized protein n=1 Tax=Acer negundo TaxID=4023 RepID=A0AAD5P0W6_ACENE|nr:hypothetical protein LWI28_003333 [Acer negundo]